MGLLQLRVPLSNTNLANRVEGCALKLAKSIMTESAGTPNHAARRALALELVQSGFIWSKWSRWVATDGTVVSAMLGAANDGAAATALDGINDAALESLVHVVWDFVAGVPPASGA